MTNFQYFTGQNNNQYYILNLRIYSHEFNLESGVDKETVLTFFDFLFFYKMDKILLFYFKNSPETLKKRGIFTNPCLESWF